jgi:hypothetical protein
LWGRKEANLWKSFICQRVQTGGNCSWRML